MGLAGADGHNVQDLDLGKENDLMKSHLVANMVYNHLYAAEVASLCCKNTSLLQEESSVAPTSGCN